MPEPQTAVDISQLMRTIGFAATPGVLRMFGFIPGVTIPVFVVSAIWMLAAMIVAVRHALDYTSTGRAVAVCAGMGAGHGICVRVGSGVRTERFVGLPDDGRTEVLRYTSDANRLI